MTSWTTVVLLIGITTATGQKSEAELVTLSPMTCNPSPGEETVDEGDNVDVACIVEYAGYEAPILNWAEMTASPGESNDTHSKSTSYFVAGRHHDMMELTCLLSFNENVASPEFTDRCTTFFHVNHAVGEISFTPSPDDASNGKVIRYVGEEVNCTADERPEPDFTWLVGETEINDTEGTLVTYDSMLGTGKYTCLARNMFQGVEKVTSREVTIEVRAHPASAGATILTNLLCLQPTIMLLTSLLLTWA